VPSERATRCRRYVLGCRRTLRGRAIPALNGARPAGRCYDAGAMSKSRRKLRSRALEIVDRLDEAMPEARIALRFRTDIELLVSVILSAQCTDVRVNLITPRLFQRFPDAAAYARVRPQALWPFIRSCGLFRNKAKNIVAAMRAIERDHSGAVPRDRDALEALPGVGRKSAGVVLIQLGAGHAFPVDTHVGRVSRRLGLSREENPNRVEQDLMALVPEERWGAAHQLLVWHGRRTCTARRPSCSRCAVEALCPKVGVTHAMKMWGRYD
jgi:endonuclease-3